MKCVRPRIVYDGNFKSEYPCGKCPACRRARTREWANRIIHELSYWESSCFLTLTYDNDHLPSQLVKRDLQLFIKRVRKHVEPRNIKYFACGEYGDQFGRPHYHILFFGISKTEEALFKIHEISKGRFKCIAWDYGFIDIGAVNYKSAAYVAGYIQKKLGEWKYDGRQPPFQIQSQGIGKRYVIENEKRLVENLGFTMNGAKCSLPRYYRKKLASKINQDDLNELSEKRSYELDDFLEESGYDPVNDRMEYKVNIRRLKEKEIEQISERAKKRSF